jgi:hypothetical protein
LTQLNVEVGFDMYYLNEMPEDNILLAAKFKTKIVKVKAGELLFKLEDAIEVVNEIERLNAVILGLDFWQKCDDGDVMEVNSADWQAINSGKNASKDTVKETRELLKNGLPDNADYVSFVLKENNNQ